VIEFSSEVTGPSRCFVSLFFFFALILRNFVGSQKAMLDCQINLLLTAQIYGYVYYLANGSGGRFLFLPLQCPQSGSLFIA